MSTSNSIPPENARPASSPLGYAWLFRFARFFRFARDSRWSVGKAAVPECNGNGQVPAR
jgi:hypothetical protein